MNRHEAKALLVAQLAVFRQRPFADLVRLVDEPEVATEVAPSGHSNQLEFNAVWDSAAGHVLRVFGAIDDGGWRALTPMTCDFLVRNDGTLVEE